MNILRPKLLLILIIGFIVGSYLLFFGNESWEKEVELEVSPKIKNIAEFTIKPLHDYECFITSVDSSFDKAITRVFKISDNDSVGTEISTPGFGFVWVNNSVRELKVSKTGRYRLEIVSKGETFNTNFIIKFKQYYVRLSTIIYIFIFLIIFYIVTLFSQEKVTRKLVKYHFPSFLSRIITVLASVGILLLIIDEIGLSLSEFKFDIFIFSWTRKFFGLSYAKYLIYIFNLILFLPATYDLMSYYTRLSKEYDTKHAIKLQSQRVYFTMVCGLFTIIITFMQSLSWGEIGSKNVLNSFETYVIPLAFIILAKLIFSVSKKCTALDKYLKFKHKQIISDGALLALFIAGSQTMVTKAGLLLVLIPATRDLIIKFFNKLLRIRNNIDNLKKDYSFKSFVSIGLKIDWYSIGYLFMISSIIPTLLLWQIHVSPFAPFQAGFPKSTLFSLLMSIDIMILYIAIKSKRSFFIVFGILLMSFFRYGLPMIFPDIVKPTLDPPGFTIFEFITKGPLWLIYWPSILFGSLLSFSIHVFVFISLLFARNVNYNEVEYYTDRTDSKFLKYIKAYARFSFFKPIALLIGFSFILFIFYYYWVAYKQNLYLSLIIVISFIAGITFFIKSITSRPLRIGFIQFKERYGDFVHNKLIENHRQQLDRWGWTGKGLQTTFGKICAIPALTFCCMGLMLLLFHISSDNIEHYKPVWKISTEKQILGLILEKNVAIALDETRQELFATDTDSGNILWKFQIKNKDDKLDFDINSGRVLVYKKSGFLRCLDLWNGNELWNVKVEPWAWTSYYRAKADSWYIYHNSERYKDFSRIPEGLYVSKFGRICISQNNNLEIYNLHGNTIYNNHENEKVLNAYSAWESIIIVSELENQIKIIQINPDSKADTLLTSHNTYIRCFEGKKGEIVVFESNITKEGIEKIGELKSISLKDKEILWRIPIVLGIWSNSTKGEPYLISTNRIPVEINNRYQFSDSDSILGINLQTGNSWKISFIEQMLSILSIGYFDMYVNEGTLAIQGSGLLDNKIIGLDKNTGEFLWEKGGKIFNIYNDVFLAGITIEGRWGKFIALSPKNGNATKIMGSLDWRLPQIFERWSYLYDKILAYMQYDRLVLVDLISGDVISEGICFREIATVKPIFTNDGVIVWKDYEISKFHIESLK